MGIKPGKIKKSIADNANEQLGLRVIGMIGKLKCVQACVQEINWWKSHFQVIGAYRTGLTSEEKQPKVRPVTITQGKSQVD